MKVRIDKNVFTEVKDEAKQIELSFLLNIIIYKHRYELKVTDEEVLSSDSFAVLTKTDQKVIEESLIDSIRSSSDDADCDVMAGGEIENSGKIFSPTEAIVYLLQPLSIILENGLNDSHFMKAIFQLFDTTGSLINRVNEGWIRFENAGGCSNVKNFLTARIKSFGDRQKFLNCFVLLDGDRRYPSDPEPDIKYKKLKETLESWDVDYHILEKRCMENYMPDEAMDSFANEKTQSWLMAYHTLTPQQKDCYSIAEGFEKDITKEQKSNVRRRESLLTTKDVGRRKKSYVRGYLQANEQLFYTGVSNGNFLHLEKGLQIKDFKVKFPEKFDDTTVTYKTNLLNRTCHQKDPLELEHIVGSICSMI